MLVNGSDFAVVRARQTLDELLTLDNLPPWLAADGSAERGAA